MSPLSLLRPSIPLPSRRRLIDSPVLPLEAVAFPISLQSTFESALHAASITPRKMRRATRPTAAIIARETSRRPSKPLRGAPRVPPPPSYDAGDTTLATAAFRAPGSLATNVYVATEALRRGVESPKKILDWGGGVGVAVVAAHRVWGVREAVVVDKSPEMRALGKQMLVEEGAEEGAGKVCFVEGLKEVGEGRWDVVWASYALNEVAREAMSAKDMEEGEESEEVHGRGGREGRVRLAEKRLRKMVRALWARTEPGGVFVVVEDGTAAGFETVLFARETVLRMARRGEEGGGGEEREEEGVGYGAQVLAPCLHSRTCPLDGNITRHRLCRFQQRFNRPPFLRRALPMHNGFEDEYFSYIIIQKTLPAQAGEDAMTKESSAAEERDGWGRLVRAPLLKGKHVVVDACTVDATLERRVISKQRSSKEQYMWARRSKWGDVWPEEPAAKPQPVNF